MDVVSPVSRPAIFPSYSSSLQDLRALANALPRNLEYDPLYAATVLHASNVASLHLHSASNDVEELSPPPALSFTGRMQHPSQQQFADSSSVAAEGTATSTSAALAAQASQPPSATPDSGQQSHANIAQQAQPSTSNFYQSAPFTRVQAASFTSSNAFPPSPRSAYSNSPNTPLGFAHTSPSVASPALDSRMIQQGPYISSFGSTQSYGTPVTAQFPVVGGCSPAEHPQQQSGYFGGSHAPAGHLGLHRKSSSAGSSAGFDALGLQHAPYSSMATDDSGGGGVMQNTAMFGSPQPQAETARFTGFAIARRSSIPSRRGSQFSPKPSPRSPYQAASSNLAQSSGSPQSTMPSPLSEQLVIPPGHSPHIQNYNLLPQGVRTEGISGSSPMMAHATTAASQSPRISFSTPTTPPSITPPSGVGLSGSSSPQTITIVRTKAPRKPKKQLPVPEPGLNKASRGRAVPTQVELQDTGVWDGDIAAAHSKAKIRERIQARRTRVAENASATSADSNVSATGVSVKSEGTLFGAGEGQESSVSPQLASLAVSVGHAAMPTVHVVSPRSYVCPVSSCSKAFKRREHLRRHLRSIHTNDKPHACPHQGCNKRFSRTDNLWQHVKTHDALPGASGFRDGSIDVAADAHPSSDTGSGWHDALAATAAPPLLHNQQPMLGSSTSLYSSGGYQQFSPMPHYEYSEVRQAPDAAPHAQFMSSAASHAGAQQPMWQSMPHATQSMTAFQADNVSMHASFTPPGPAPPSAEPGHQPYPHGRF